MPQRTFASFISGIIETDSLPQRRISVWLMFACSKVSVNMRTSPTLGARLRPSDLSPLCLPLLCETPKCELNTKAARPSAYWRTLFHKNMHFLESNVQPTMTYHHSNHTNISQTWEWNWAICMFEFSNILVVQNPSELLPFFKRLILKLYLWSPLIMNICCLQHKRQCFWQKNRIVSFPNKAIALGWGQGKIKSNVNI